MNNILAVLSVLMCCVPLSQNQTFWVDLETANVTANLQVLLVNKEEATLGPLFLDERTTVACIIKSNASVDDISATWTLSSVELNSQQVVSSRKILSSLSLLPKRSHHQQRLCCIAVWNGLFNVANDCAVIDIIAPPQSARIVLPSPLLEGVPCEVHCIVSGSRPPPVVWWTLGRRPLTESLFRPGDDTDQSALSVLVFTPEPSHAGLNIECRAANPLMPRKQAAAKDILQITKGPEVRLWLGRGLNASRIKRGSDVFFECMIETTLPDWIPKRNHEVTWLKDGTALSPRELVRGADQMNNSPVKSTIGGYLVLRNVSIRDEGNYSCRVESQLHKRTLVSISNRIAIRVQYPPRCRWRSVQTIWVDVLAPSVSLRCESVPVGNQLAALDAPDRYRWRVASREFCEQNPSLHIADSRDLLHHSIHCWAYNWVGVQLYPCVFHLLPKPSAEESSLANKQCRIADTTEQAVVVECNQEMGYVTAKEVYSGRGVFSMTVRERRVTLTSLRPGTLHVLNAGGQLFHVTTRPMATIDPTHWPTLLNWIASQTYLTTLAGLCTLTTAFVFLLILRRSHGRWRHQHGDNEAFDLGVHVETTDDVLSRPFLEQSPAPSPSLGSEVHCLQLYPIPLNHEAKFVYERRV